MRTHAVNASSAWCVKKILIQEDAFEVFHKGDQFSEDNIYSYTINHSYIYSYAGHLTFPNIYTGMKDPTKFTKASIVSYLLVTLLYIPSAFMGAKLFGPQVNSQITLSMPRELIATRIALWAIVLTPITKYALSFAPAAIQLEQHLPLSLTSKAKIIIRGIVGAILLLVILVLALSVPYFKDVRSLTGSLVSVVMCMILPCTFYIKILWYHILRSALILNVLIAISVLLGASRTISSSTCLLESSFNVV